MEGWLRYNSSRVYGILEGQQFMFYNRFDQVLGIPTGLRGVINIRDGKVEKTMSQNDKHGVHIRSKGWGASGVFGCDGPSSCSSWYSALRNATELHLKKQERLDAPRKYRELLGLPVEGYLQKKNIVRAYKKMCLKCHPDRGGDRDEFNRLQDAYSSIMALQEAEDLRHNCVIYDYEAVIEKDARAGLGLVVKEDHALGRVVVSKIEATVKIKGMSKEGKGYIKIGDAIVGIDDDDTTEWPLSRIRGRLGPSRLPPGGTVTFIFERRDSIDPEPIIEEEPPITPMPSTSYEGVHPSWDNAEENTEQKHPSWDNAEENTEQKHPSWDNADENSKEGYFTRPHSSPPSVFASSTFFSGTEQRSSKALYDNEGQKTVRESKTVDESGDDESSDFLQTKRLLYESSPMSPVHRGSVRELSFVDPAVEPLYEMEELFDLLETVRISDQSAPCFDTDAHHLKELVAKEILHMHSSLDSNGKRRVEEVVAQLTALRHGSAIEANQSYNVLCKNSKFGSAPALRQELNGQLLRDAQDIDNIMCRLYKN